MPPWAECPEPSTWRAPGRGAARRRTRASRGRSRGSEPCTGRPGCACRWPKRTRHWLSIRRRSQGRATGGRRRLHGNDASCAWSDGAGRTVWLSGPVRAACRMMPDRPSPGRVFVSPPPAASAPTPHVCSLHRSLRSPSRTMAPTWIACGDRKENAPPRRISTLQHIARGSEGERAVRCAEESRRLVRAGGHPQSLSPRSRSPEPSRGCRPRPRPLPTRAVWRVVPHGGAMRVVPRARGARPL